MREEINVRLRDELSVWDAQCRQQGVRLLDACCGTFVFRQRHLHFEEVSQVLDAVEVYTRATHTIHRAMFAHASRLTIRH